MSAGCGSVSREHQTSRPLTVTDRAVVAAEAELVGAAHGGIGVGASIAAARPLADRLFGVPPHDTTVLLSAVAVWVEMVGAANWLPARRAARLDPMRSLRAE